MTARRPRKSTTARGLGWRHQQQAEVLKRHHRDGAPCPWCGRPLYLDRTRNWDYDPAATNPANGSLHADHGEISRAEATLRGIPIPLPNRLVHGWCNAQRGDGRRDHLRPGLTDLPVPEPSNESDDDGIGYDTLLMPWPRWK